MSATWDLPDFDDHEAVHLFRDSESGLSAIIAVHSTHLGPAAGGVRFWHYSDSTLAITDALRLSRGMSFKNAMAGLPMGGGKAVILADEAKTKTPEMLRAFGRIIDSLGGRYVTAEDVGMTTGDMVEIRSETDHVSGLPVVSGAAGGDPGPYTALGVFLGVKAAAFPFDEVLRCGAVQCGAVCGACQVYERGRAGQTYTSGRIVDRTASMDPSTKNTHDYTCS